MDNKDNMDNMDKIDKIDYSEHTQHTQQEHEGARAEQERLARERIELMKLKQGLIAESDVIRDTRPQITQLHGLARVQNFWYHNKLYIFMCVFAAALLTWFIVDIATREKYDMKMLSVTKSYEVELMQDGIEQGFEAHVPDFDGDGKANLELYPIFLDEEGDAQIYMANITKLSGEIQVAEAMLILCEDDLSDSIYAEDALEDLTALYPGNANVRGRGYYIAGTKFAKSLGWEDCPEDVYIGLRVAQAANGDKEKLQERYDHAKQVLDSIVGMG